MTAPVPTVADHDEAGRGPTTSSTGLPTRLVVRAATLTRAIFDRLTLRPGSVALVGVLGLATAATAVLQTRALEHGTGCSPLPVAVMRLEVTFSAPRFVRLLDSEAPCTANVVRSFYTWDVLFPLAYGPFFAALYLWTERWRRFTDKDEQRRHDASVRRDLFVVAPLAAAVLDVAVENAGLLAASALAGAPHAADTLLLKTIIQVASAGALAKWLLLVLAAGGIVTELIAGPRGAVLARTRFSVLAVLLGAVPLLAVPQGRDILQRLFEGDHPAWRLLAAVPPLLFAAAAIWYCGRQLTELQLGERPDGNGWYHYFGKYIPRVLGTASLVLPGLAFARVADAQVLYLAAAVAGFAAAFLGRTLLPSVVAAIGRPFLLPAWRTIEQFDTRLGQALVASVVALWFPFVGAGEARYLRWAAYLCFVSAWLFQLFVTFRRHAHHARHGGAATLAMEPALDAIAAHAVGRGLIVRVAAAAAAGAALLLLFTFAPVAAGRALGPLWILCLAVANGVFVGSVLVWAGHRFRVPIVAAAVLLMVLFSLWNDSHHVRTLDTSSAAAIAGRPSIAAAFDAWTRSQATAPPDTPAYGTAAGAPVVLVAGAGGGLRAAYWTAMSLAAMADSVPGFDRRVFAFSGVSGGSLGGTLFAALARDRQQAAAPLRCGTPANESRLAGRTTGVYATCVRDFMRDDFLSPVVAKLVAPDLLQLFLPFPVSPFDRSGGLEGSWEASYQRATGRDTFTGGFLAFADTTRITAPVLILNSTHVETGRRYMASSVYLDTNGGHGVPLRDSVDVLDTLARDMPLSTAIHNSARFTYVSPAGHMDAPDGREHGRLVDGGYFENSGLATLREVYDVLRTRGVEPYVLYLCNGPAACNATASTEVQSAAADEIASPFRALYKARDARGTLAQESLKALAGERFLQLNVCSELPRGLDLASTVDESPDEKDAVKEAARQKVVSPPLGWLLSKQARDWMDASLAGEQPGDGSCYARNAAVIARLQAAVKP